MDTDIKITAATLRKLKRLLEGETLPASSLGITLADTLTEEGVVSCITHKSRKTYKALPGLKAYISSAFNIHDIDAAIAVLEGADTQRSTQVEATGDSKTMRQRTMKGFMVSTLKPLEATLQGKPFIINPLEGSFVYIYDYEQFSIPEDVLIIGIENAENFRQLDKQKYLFPDRPTLFVSRYPLSGDFPKWLNGIENEYLHFGDFDLAGISIFLNEIYRHAGARSSFLIPDDIEERLPRGSTKRYDAQLPQYGNLQIPDDEDLKPLQWLLKLIHKFRRGYDQEGYIIDN